MNKRNMKLQRPIRLCGLSLTAFMALVLPAWGQFRVSEFFGGKGASQPGQNQPQPAPKQSGPRQPSRTAANQPQPENSHRLTEVMIELAWLADPITFPYFLEARTGVGALEVRGYVPTKAVRDKAMNIARVHCQMQVVDGLKEHSSLSVRTVPRTPEQLQSAVEAALHEAFPQQHQEFRVQCFPGGLVQVTGAVASHEQKLAVSQSLRRLHGCSSISNLTQVGGYDPVEQAQAGPKKTGYNAAKEEKPAKKGFFSWFTRPTADKKDPRAGQAIAQQPNKGLVPAQTVSNQTGKPGDPYETRGTAALLDEPAGLGKQPPSVKTMPHLQQPPKNSPPLGPTTGSVANLKKRIETALPGREVQVTLLPNNGIRLEVRPRPGEDSGQLAGQIFTIPELEPFGERVELHFLLANEK